MTVYDNIRNNSLKTFMLVLSYPLVLGATLYLLLYTAFMKMSSDDFKAYLAKNYFFEILLVTIILIVIGTTIYSLVVFLRNEDIITLSYTTEYDRGKHREVSRILQNISITAGIHCPYLIIYPSASMNAYATGVNPNDSTIVITSGLVNNLTMQELEAVIAHEIAHIANRDTKLMMVILMHVATLMTLGELMISSGRIVSRVLILLIIPILGALLIAVTFLISPLFRLAISRKREFIADSTAVLYTRNPEALVEALIIISSNSEVESFAGSDISALCISAPSNKPNFIQRLFHTHPPMDERIEAIMKGSYIIKG